MSRRRSDRNEASIDARAVDVGAVDDAPARAIEPDEFQAIRVVRVRDQPAPAHDDLAVEAAAAAIERAVAGLEEAAMRAGRVAAAVRVERAEVLAASLERSASQSHAIAPRTCYLAWVTALLHARPRPRLPAGPLDPDPGEGWPRAVDVAKITGAASRGGHLFAHGLLREIFRLPLPDEGRVAPPHVTIEHLALGVRRARARQPARAAWAPLLVDVDPAVIELLARNPRLVEADAVRLASNPHAHPWSLWAMLLSQRWLSNAAVLVAIVSNPRCPVWLLMAVAPLVAPQPLGNALRRRTGLMAEQLEPLAGLHGGQLRDWIERRVAELRARAAPLLVEIDTAVEDAGAALEDAWRDALAAVGDSVDADVAFAREGTLEEVDERDDPDSGGWPISDVEMAVPLRDRAFIVDEPADA